MNETRNIIIGFDLGSKTSQLCYYDRKEKEPISLSPKAGSNQYQFPTCLSKKSGEDIWHYGFEAEYFIREKDEISIDSFYEACHQDELISVDGQMRHPWEILAIFLEEVLTMLGVADPIRQISAIMTTTKELTGPMVRNLQKAYERVGFTKSRCFLQDYEESFYYYVLNQKTEYRNRKIAWFTFEEEEVAYAHLVTDNKTKPILVTIEKGKTISLPSDSLGKDLQFYQLIHESFKTDNYASVYIVGEGFEKEWAKRSIPLLCKGQRHVFYGNNLFVKGACCGAREKVEEKNLKNYLYAGSSLVKYNIGMEMLVQGNNAWYPVIEAGKNWYESVKEFEIILDDKKELIFRVYPMDGKTATSYSMQLPGLPKRPNRTTRLHILVAYESPTVCVITVKDLGFGEMYPGSGQVWTEKMSW